MNTGLTKGLVLSIMLGREHTHTHTQTHTHMHSHTYT